MATLKKITIEGYKSIRQMSLELRPLNVLIGANGAGKSNLLSFFKLLSRISRGRLERFVGQSGGANSLLFYGAKTTPQLGAILELETPVQWSEYTFQLAFSAGDKLTFHEEKLQSEDLIVKGEPQTKDFGSGHSESKLPRAANQGDRAADTIHRVLRHCGPFQFHDTSDSSRVRTGRSIRDSRPLRNDAGNVAAVLYRLRESETYDRIVQTIRQIAPWFGDFVLQLTDDNHYILLEWKERHSDVVFPANSLSDGTLRVMALVTLLLQPELPSLIVIDEPELGLHPFAVVVLAALIKQAACRSQVILATESRALLDEFEPEDVIVVDRAVDEVALHQGGGALQQGESTFQRLEPERLNEWLQEYSLAELWEKNVLGGGPA